MNAFSPVSNDRAWADLRRHLERTGNEPTVVMFAAQTRAQTQSLKERVELWCRRARRSWTEPEAGQLLTSWLSRYLPVPGVLFLDLWDDQVRHKVLRTLNEMQVHLARSESGCLIICGPIALLGEASREAADLWSIRSLTCVIGSGAEEPVDLVRESEGELEARRDLSVSLQNLGWAAEMRGDWDAASAAYQEFLELTRELVELQGTPQARRDVSVALNKMGRVGETFGDWTKAEAAYQESLEIRQGLEKELGTPKARRDLSVSLDNIGRVAEARGDWDKAETAYQETLRLARELEELLGTPQTRRELSLTLESIGRVAEARGDW
ncbi:tetratricopeptide repeat protein, partial [Actinomyces johnsonii]